MGNEDYIRTAIEKLKGGVKVEKIDFHMPEDKEFVDMLIQGLNKQITKKAIIKAGTHSGGRFCPTCNKIYWNGEILPSYCNGCGQKIN